jgi:hypothetical protein
VEVITTLLTSFSGVEKLLTVPSVPLTLIPFTPKLNGVPSANVPEMLSVLLLPCAMNEFRSKL